MRLAIFAAAMFVWCSASAQMIYKCQDAEGNVSYGSSPCTNEQSEMWSREAQPAKRSLPASGSRSGSGPAGTSLEVDPDDPCVGMASLAERIMRSRQDGADITQMYQAADGDIPAINNLVEVLVTAAYKKPRYSTESMKRRTISEFKVEAMLMCRESRGK